jgi:hypothetical protein
VGWLKKLGVQYVLDTHSARSISLMETASEFIARLRASGRGGAGLSAQADKCSMWGQENGSSGSGVGSLPKASRDERAQADNPNARGQHNGSCTCGVREAPEGSGRERAVPVALQRVGAGQVGTSLSPRLSVRAGAVVPAHAGLQSTDGTASRGSSLVGVGEGSRITERTQVNGRLNGSSAEQLRTAMSARWNDTAGGAVSAHSALPFRDNTASQEGELVGVGSVSQDPERPQGNGRLNGLDVGQRQREHVLTQDAGAKLPMLVSACPGARQLEPSPLLALWHGFVTGDGVFTMSTEPRENVHLKHLRLCQTIAASSICLSNTCACSTCRRWASASGMLHGTLVSQRRWKVAALPDSCRDSKRTLWIRFPCI